ncbi:ATP-binding protein [Actinoplanes sp. TRM 88003]|uniref:ATP-binding protein n=1 Tax=Paractinoplanes aksuensis TaxID=2939490 RepID=A0ABT1E1Q2_9ACTN|nr:ATP-binding protein [Actinoplanes aksuensis]MCO8277068.1 ATP-binding protein [Actinoplanes aksuensis]
MSRELAALDAVNLSPVLTSEEVWASLEPHHVGSLHSTVSRRLSRSITLLAQRNTPTISVLQGDRGSGKTHLLGWARQEIQRQGGFFFYMKLVAGQDFWTSATGSLIDSLYRKEDGGQDQLLYLLGVLTRDAGIDVQHRAAILGELTLTRAAVDAFVDGIRRLDRQVGNEAADTARALALLASYGDAVEHGKAYLADDPGAVETRAEWGLSGRRRPAQLLLRDLTRLFALAGPLVFAFDQLDDLVRASDTSLASPANRESRIAQRMSGDIASGLMDLREETRRTLMIVACQEDSWQKISRAAVVRSALDRFEVLPALGEIPDKVTATAIVSRRLRLAYESVQFEPPYATWPIADRAFAEVPSRYTARRLLVRVAEHIATCVQSGVVTELESLEDRVASPALTRPVATVDSEVLNDLFDKLRDEADATTPLDKATEDSVMPALLEAGLLSLIHELEVDQAKFTIDADFGGKHALHARLRYQITERTDREAHWSFRGIASENPIAAQNRIRDAVAEAGLAKGLPTRRLTLLRNTGYPSGQRMTEIREDFVARGGLPVPISGGDLRTLAALRTMLNQRPPGLEAWLRTAKPSSRTELFAVVADDLRQYLNGPTDQESVEATAPADIIVGVKARGGAPFLVATSQLTKHTVVVGAAGSGKTVLVKRLIEQCALRGVSAIVLDPNDDLARLGDRWPQPPDGWTPEQEEQAERYFGKTEVLVWTPGLKRGRPLSFHPLPDFGPVLTDEDDFQRLIASTVASLGPQAGIRGNGSRALQQQGVLQRALATYVRSGERTLTGFVDYLNEPPDGLFNSRTRRIAMQIADTLEAVAETDRLFDESIPAADPGMLLTPAEGMSSRISVINFVGLSKEEGTRFVARLQATLFSWFKAHPAGVGRLGGLLVMDEAQNFVPAVGANTSTNSTIEIIRQVRKYGLGVVLASQAPKGIHNQVFGNTANQFFGRLTAPAQIAAAQHTAELRNTSLEDLSSLSVGMFYGAGEGTSFTKIQAPLCLSHDGGPLREDEVVARAHRRS